MPQLSRKRGRAAGEEEENHQDSYMEGSNEANGYEEEQEDNASGSISQLAKGFVRYALACEYARIPIRRQDVAQKVLGSHSRQFKQVFEAGNGKLLDTFGMELIELPNKEKTTMRQKRAAAASESQSKSSNQWVLRNALPEEFRTSDIMGPPRIPTSELESIYVGLYTMIISLISLSGGALSEGKLDRFLKRMNANQSTALDATDEVIKKMVKEGYLVKVKDTTSGEDLIDYHVGPRGKVEVGEEGVANMVRKVYSGAAVDDLDQRLNRSLGMTGDGGERAQDRAVSAGAGASADATPTQGGGGRRGGPTRPRRAREEDEDY